MAVLRWTLITITTEEDTILSENRPYVNVNSRLKGFTTYCGFEFEEISDDKAVVLCPLRPELLNPIDIAHGGLIAALMDVSAGTMALQADRNQHSIVTQSCNIHYLRPGVGSCLRAESRLIRKGHRVCVVQSDCYTDSGALSATAIYEIVYLDT